MKLNEVLVLFCTLINLVKPGVVFILIYYNFDTTRFNDDNKVQIQAHYIYIII